MSGENEDLTTAPARERRPLKCPRCGARAVEVSSSGFCWCGSCGEELSADSLDAADTAEETDQIPRAAMILAGLILGGIIGGILGIFLELPELPAGITGGVLGAAVGAFSRGEA